MRSKMKEDFEGGDYSNVPPAPDRIYLQWNVGPNEYPTEDDTWCEDRQEDEDVPYIRADLVEVILAAKR